jgi:hypothetical protein
MSRTRTLTNLLTDIRQRTNQENSTFVTDAELTEYLNQELAELWTKLVQGSGQPFYRSSQAYTVTGATTLQALPATFFEVQEVTATIAGITGALAPFMASEHGWLQSSAVWGSMVALPPRYRIQASNIEFLPVQQSFTATLYYSPTQPRLVASNDTFDGFAGFEIAAIYGACATVLAKEESDPTFYLGQRERIYSHITSLASQRDASAPERVQDVTGGGERWP